MGRNSNAEAKVDKQFQNSMDAAASQKNQEDKAINGAKAAIPQSEKIKSGNDFIAPFEEEAQPAP